MKLILNTVEDSLEFSKIMFHRKNMIKINKEYLIFNEMANFLIVYLYKKILRYKLIYKHSFQNKEIKDNVFYVDMFPKFWKKIFYPRYLMKPGSKIELSKNLENYIEIQEVELVTIQ